MISTRPVVWMYSGQGSQYFAMGQQLYEAEPVFRDTFDELSRYAQRWTGVSLTDVVYRHSGRRFDPFAETRLTHPALFTVQYAMDCLLRSRGWEPAFLLGYSLGEFVALTTGGVLDWRDTLAALMHHAQALDASPTAGHMLAILHDPALFTELTARFPALELAAVNAPRHFVITGPVDAVLGARGWLAFRDIESVILPVSHAFHSAAVEEADRSVQQLLATFRISPLRTPFVSCSTGQIAHQRNGGFPKRVTRSIIQFQKALQLLENTGPKLYLDLGPSGTLASFVRQNLGPGAQSEVLPIMTPFAQDRRNLEIAEERLRAVTKSPSMTTDNVFQVVKGVVQEVLPDVNPADIQIGVSLAALGANSIDRMDVTLGAMEALGLRIPMTDFSGVASLEALVAVLHRHAVATAGRL